MLPEFDPVGLRDFWLETRLEYELRDVPDDLTHTSCTAHACMTASSLFEGYLLGLWDELRGRAEEHIKWMESQPEPDRTIHLDAGVSADGWRDNLHEWRRSLGLCKWLSRGDFAFDDLTAAAAADWQVLELATPRNASRARESRRNYSRGATT